jgi:hypothetical protein
MANDPILVVGSLITSGRDSVENDQLRFQFVGQRLREADRALGVRQTTKNANGKETSPAGRCQPTRCRAADRLKNPPEGN